MLRSLRIVLIVVPGLAGLMGCRTSSPPPSSPIVRMWEEPAAAGARPATPSPSGSPGSAGPTASGPAPNASASPRPEEVLAYVNGTPITRAFAGEELVRTHGLSLLQQMVLLVAARQRSQQMGLTVTPADVQAEHDEALRRIATPLGGQDNLPLDRLVAERLLTEFLLAKNIARAEWQRRMEQQAYLRKIATAELEKTTLTEQMLREEYALEYGERVQIRHIQVSNLQAERRARDMLATRNDFDLAARQLSENPVTAARGGLMPPFTRNDPSVTPLIREAAFKMKVGETSPAVHEDNWYHIIRVERRFPASSVGFEHVDRKALEARLKKRLIAQRMVELEPELFNQARVDIRDRELSEQFNRRRQAAR